MPTLIEVFGKNLKFYRKARNFTQLELAEKVNVNRETISVYESGRAGTTFETISRLAEALNIEETDLLNPHSHPKPVLMPPKISQVLEVIEGALVLYSGMGGLKAGMFDDNFPDPDTTPFPFAE